MSGFKKIISRASRRTSKLLSPTSPNGSVKSNGAPPEQKQNGDALPAPDAGPAEVTSIDDARPEGRERKPSFTEQKYSRQEDREEENEAEAKAREQRKQKAWEEDPLHDNYGDLPLNQSQERRERKLDSLVDVKDKTAGDTIEFRARVHHIRAVGPKIVFILFRQRYATIQGVLTDAEGVSQNMVRWAEGLSRETIVLVTGTLQRPPSDQGEIKSTTVHELELKITKLHVITHPTTNLPFQIEDVMRAHQQESDKNGSHFVHVGEKTRLDHRVMDLRTPAAQAVFRIRAGICRLFREYLDAQDFTEIQSSKFQEATAESGAAVFKVDYFRRPVFLAQSPQLAKQMCIAADMERVYEIGPVFRAENSNTHRHLTEFIGLDLEMAFESHYHEVIDVIDGMFKNLFRGLQTQYQTEIEAVKRTFPHDNLVFLDETPRFKFAEAVGLLNDSGWKDDDGNPADPNEDLSTAAERALGQVVKEKFHTDYYIIDKFPASARPFYTMPDPGNDQITNSYDFFLRGEEILSGGQRIHDAPMLEKAMYQSGIRPDTMREYLDGFRWGCPPHGGGGIGLERVLFLFLKLGNVRWASLFPRDPRSFAKGGQDAGEAQAAAAMATILHGPESTTLVPGKQRTHDLPPLENLIAKYGDATNTSWVDPAWTVWRDSETGAAVGYIPSAGFAVTFGNPLCDPKQIPHVVDAYLGYILTEKKLKPVWCCIDKQTEHYLAEKLGWSALIAVAEERINPTEVDPDNDKNVRRKIHRAEREGVKVTEVEGAPEGELKKEIEERCKEWSDNRKGTQVHLTGVRPFDDVEHRRYFYARDKEGKMCALVVLAQLSVAHGFQIKWALEFPHAPLGAIEYILAYVIKMLGDAGVKSATFGAGATAEMVRVENIGGFRVRTLEKAYNGLSHTFHLTNKNDFRSKFGTHQEPLYVCYPKGGLGVKGIQAIMNMLQMQK